MTNDEYSDPAFDLAVDQRVGEAAKRVDPTAVARYCAEAGVRLDQARDAFEFIEEPARYGFACFGPIVARGCGKIAFCVSMDGPTH